ncbi:hypothetical protein IWX75_000041 [Arthrobacter sp. CAN_A6]|uniref:hypothetical protein n=1 Tax=Arthrobacter sp. CAN_A6 TaxID=2787721 RepID=UPI0018CBE19B
MSLHHRYSQEPALRRDELHQLEEVRESLAADVIKILSAVTRTTSDVPDTRSGGHLGSGPSDKQTLLYAAIVDLETLDKRLHHARYKALVGASAAA